MIERTTGLEQGGPAFPNPANEGRGCDAWDGMTLRDYFAARALQAIVNAAALSAKEEKANPRLWAQTAYALADAMLEARTV